MCTVRHSTRRRALALVAGAAALVPLAPHHATAAALTPFAGQFVATDTATVQPPATVHLATVGAGIATHLGQASLTKQVTITLSAQPCTAGGVSGIVTAFTGTDTLTAASGDSLTLSYSGTTCHTSGTNLIAAPYTVAGGTGRFSGASGGGTLTVQSGVETNGVSTETTLYQGALSAPGSAASS